MSEEQLELPFMENWPRYTDSNCPKCGARLLVDKDKVFCSFLGAGENYPPCDYVDTISQ